jgi:membrane dipeptidase
LKKQKSSLTRSEFLRMMSLSGLSLLVSPVLGFSHSRKNEISGNPDDFIEKLFAESLIIDGLVNVSLKKSKGASHLVPGEIKRLTGIDVGNHSTRVNRLVNRNRWIELHSDALLRIDKASDIETARKTNRYGIVYYAQLGFDLGGSIEPLAKWKEEGLRVLQIAYGDNELGGGSSSDDSPLSSLGKKVVKELNRLRMVVDISHCGRRTTLDVTEASSDPVTANHANVERLTNNGRNKSDEELKAIAGTGGMVGVTTVNQFLIRNPARPATIDDFVAHIDYMVEKIGIDHVGISSDASLDGNHRYEVGYSDAFLCSSERWKHVARGLHKMGYSHEDLQKILGLNFKRIYDQVLDP